MLKFIYSGKATKVCEISTVDLSHVVPVKSTVEILQNFVAFWEYMNFNQASEKIFSKPIQLASKAKAGPMEHMGIVGICPNQILASTLTLFLYAQKIGHA